MKGLRAIICILFLFGTALPAFCQSYIDSLVINLEKAETSEAKIKVINNYIDKIAYYNPDTAIYYVNHGIALAKKISDVKNYATFLGVKGACNTQLSNYSESLKYLFKAVEVNDEIKDSSLYRFLYNNLGNVYRESGQLNEAEDYYARGLDVSRLIGDSSGMAMGFNNLGIIYMMRAEYPMGMSLWGNSLSIKLAIGDSLGASTTMSNMAMYYRDIKQTEKALDYLTRALEIKKKYNDYSGASVTYDNLGELYLQLKDYKKAIMYYQLSLDQAKLSSSKRLESTAYLNLSSANKAKGDYEKALEYFELHSLLEDSIMSQKTLNDLSIAESKFENDRKAHVIEKMSIKEEVQSAEIAHQVEEAKRQRLIKWSFGFGAFGMLLFGLVMLRNYKRKKSDHKLIVEQKAEVEEQHKEITDSINYAKRIQAAILPSDKLVKEYLENSFIFYQPKDIVAGDFYWMEHASNVIASEKKQSANEEQIASDSSIHRNDVILFAAADCTGHGVPGAMVSVVCNNALNRAVREFGLQEPAKILDKVTDLVIEQFEKSEEEVKDGMDIALCSLEFLVPSSLLKKGNQIIGEKQRTENRERGTVAKLQYAGANNPIWIIRDGELLETKGTKQPIGKYDKRTLFENHVIELQKGDSIYIFTDGYVDQFGGEKGKKFKSKAFRELLLSIQSKSMLEQKEVLNKSFENWRGELEQIDDVCVIGLRV